MQAQQDETAACEPASLGRLERYGLGRSLERSFPWIDARWAEGSPAACQDAAGRLQAEVEFEPHARGPRWEVRWSVLCQHQGWLAWTCGEPIETTLVRLAADDRGSLVFDGVAFADALAALGAVLNASRRGEVSDPFRDDTLPIMLLPDDLLSVSREPFCGGLLVTAREPGEDDLLQLCVVLEPCPPGHTCAARVDFQGKSG